MSSSLNIMEGTRQYHKNLLTTCIERVFIILTFVRSVQSRNRKTDFYFCQSKSIKMEIIQTETAGEHLKYKWSLFTFSFFFATIKIRTVLQQDVVTSDKQLPWKKTKTCCNSYRFWESSAKRHPIVFSRYSDRLLQVSLRTELVDKNHSLGLCKVYMDKSSEEGKLLRKF